MNYRKEEKILYQIGRGSEDFYIFDCFNLDHNIPIGFKKEEVVSNNQDGSQRLRGAAVAYKNPYVLSVSFMQKDNDKITENYIHKMFSKGRQIAFFYEVTTTESDTGKPKLRWFYNLIDIETPPVHEFKQMNEFGNEYKSYTAEIKLVYTGFFECTDELRYFNETAYDANQLYWNNGSLAPLNNTWGSGTVYWGQTYNVSFPLYTSLTIDNAFSLFASENRAVQVDILDRYLTLTTKGLTTTDQLSITLTSNSRVQTTSAALNYTETSAQTRIMLIQFNPLATNEYIDISNDSNGSGIRIIWTASSANTNDVYLNTKTGLFYDAVTHAAIPITSCRYEKIGGDLLLFSPLDSINPYRTPTSEILFFQKSTSANNTIKINILKTYA